jgi:hypothetical protein
MPTKFFSRSSVLALSLGLLLTTATASFALPSDGSSEVLLSGGFFHAQGSDDGNFNADVSYGYYLSPGWEIGLRQGLNYLFRDDNPDAWTATTTPFIFYNFRVTDVLVPYLGIHGGVVWNDRDVTGTIGPNAGLKLFVSPQTFVNIGYRYEWLFNTFHSAVNNRDNGNHVGNIGIGFVWGGSATRTTK